MLVFAIVDGADEGWELDETEVLAWEGAVLWVVVEVGKESGSMVVGCRMVGLGVSRRVGVPAVVALMDSGVLETVEGVMERLMAPLCVGWG